MRLVARHQIGDETFRIESGNDLPALWRSFGAGKLQSIDGRGITDLALFIKKTIRRHVRIDINAARRIKMPVMPGDRIDWRFANWRRPGRHGGRPSPGRICRSWRRG